MASKRHKESNAPTTRDSNRFSILDADPQPTPKPPTRETSPAPETRPTTPQQDDDDLLWISTKLSTTQSRVLTYREWPHANIEPQKLAKFGYFHHANDDEFDDLVECFACGNVRRGWRSESQVRLSLHESDCMWADLLRETQSWVEPESRPTTPIRSLTSTPTSPDIKQNQEHNVDNSGREQSPDSNSLSTSSPRTTYASVLKNRRQHQSSSESNPTPTAFLPSSFSPKTPAPEDRRSQLSPTSSPTLTVEDLRNRFHNRPSPFKLTGAHEIYTNYNHLTIVTTKALSNFLLSALPAFSGFLCNIHMGSCRYLSQDKRFCNRWPTGPHKKNPKQRPTIGP